MILIIIVVPGWVVTIHVTTKDGFGSISSKILKIISIGGLEEGGMYKDHSLRECSVFINASIPTLSMAWSKRLFLRELSMGISLICIE